MLVAQPADRFIIVVLAGTTRRKRVFRHHSSNISGERLYQRIVLAIGTKSGVTPLRYHFKRNCSTGTNAKRCVHRLRRRFRKIAKRTRAFRRARS